MSSPIRPEWAHMLGVLPTYVGGYLEWQDGTLQYCARITQLEITGSILVISVDGAMQRPISKDVHRAGVWEPEKPTTDIAPTSSWSVWMTSTACVPRTSPKGHVSFRLLNFRFELHMPDSAFARAIE